MVLVSAVVSAVAIGHVVIPVARVVVVNWLMHPVVVVVTAGSCWGIGLLFCYVVVLVFFFAPPRKMILPSDGVSVQITHPPSTTRHLTP